MDKILSSKLFFAVSIVFTWLSVAGIADNIIEWKQWFEVGVMEHWRAVRQYIMSWLPFEISKFWVDYLLIGLMFATVQHKDMYDNKYWIFDDDKPEGVDHEIERYIFGIGFFICSILMWIIAIFANLLPRSKKSEDEYQEWLKYHKAWNERGVVIKFFLSIIIFLPVLFIASDLIRLSG